MLTVEILSTLEGILTSDRVSYRGNELSVVAGLISAIQAERKIVEGIVRTAQDSPPSKE